MESRRGLRPKGSLVMTTLTEFETQAEVRRLNKRAKERPNDEVWVSRCKLAAKQARNLFEAEISGDRGAANNLRRFREESLNWIDAHGA